MGFTTIFSQTTYEKRKATSGNMRRFPSIASQPANARDRISLQWLAVANAITLRRVHSELKLERQQDYHQAHRSTPRIARRRGRKSDRAFDPPRPRAEGEEGFPDDAQHAVQVEALCVCLQFRPRICGRHNIICPDTLISKQFYANLLIQA